MFVICSLFCASNQTVAGTLREMLGARELINKSGKETSLLDFGGQKLFGLDDCEEETEKLTNALNQFESIVKQERVCYKDILSVAHWDSSDNIAVVDVKKGNTLQKFGYQTREGIFLKAEETLFLIDQGILELHHDGLPISLQEAYMLLLPLLPSFEFYEVYSYLCRLGFIVRRYKENNKTVKTNNGKESNWGKGLGSPVKENDIVEDEVKEDCIEPMASGYVKNLWCSDERPLLRPSDAKSTASVLTKLTIMEIIRLKDIKFSDNDETSWHIDFDVYLSQKLKKSGTPRFRVMVCKYMDDPPSLYDIGRLTKESDGVHLKLAVVNDGTVSFYGMFGVDIPSIVTVG